MPDGAPIDRARGSIRPGLQRRRMGRALRLERQSFASLCFNRYAHSWIAHGPKAPWSLERYARDLGWGVWPNACLSREGGGLGAGAGGRGGGGKKKKKKWFWGVGGGAPEKGAVPLTAKRTRLVINQ